MGERNLGARAACFLAFTTAAVTLFTQVLIHRVVSAKFLNNYAFLVISLTMLGFAVSGVVLSFVPRRLRGGEFLTGCAILFSLSLPLVTVFFYRTEESITNSATTRPAVVWALLSCLPMALLYAVPFVFLGLILGVLLDSPGLPARVIYGFDLAGSCLGALLVIPAIASMGVEKALLGACFAMLFVAVLTMGPGGRVFRWVGGLSAVTLIVLLVRVDRVFVLRYPEGSMLSATQQPNADSRLEFVEWDPVARIEVTRLGSWMATATPQWPSLTGDDPRFLRLFELFLTQNNFAYTHGVRFDGNVDTIRGIEDTIYAAAYQASTVSHPKALVIGVGGGFDILTALRFGASDITGVEVNAATLDVLHRVYRDFFKAWVDDPRVHLVNDEGRSYLSRSGDTYDVIQVSGVDSYSGTPGAAHVFSENYLYTAEAFDLYLSRLTQDGILNVMRLESTPPAHMLRALTTAVECLRRRGVARPDKHIAVISARPRNFTALLVKRTPFSDEEVQRLRRWAGASRFFQLSVVRGESTGFDEYMFFLKLRDPFWEEAYIESYPWDVRPSRDDWPFFFRSSYWWHLFPASPTVWGTVPHLEYGVLVLAALSGVACLLGVYIPLRFALGAETRPRGAWRYGAYCAGIGLGYLGIEVAFIQKFGLLLGHPNYALSVVLASLLLATGLGSLASGSILAAFGNIRFVAYALSIVLLAERTFAFPYLMRFVTLGFAGRTAVTVALVAPVGVLLGVFFPTVLAALKERAPAFVPWAWGINGAFSVLAPILAVAFSVTFGITALLLATIPVYLLSAIAWPQEEPGPSLPLPGRAPGGGAEAAGAGA
jgi:hypothetical protein